MKYHCIAIQNSQNNTIVSLISPKRKLVFTLSCGALSFKGSKKSSQAACQEILVQFAQKVLPLKHEPFFVCLSGVGKGRNLILKQLKKSGIFVSKILDKTPIAHGGCRIKKTKR